MVAVVSVMTTVMATMMTTMVTTVMAVVTMVSTMMRRRRRAIRGLRMMASASNQVAHAPQHSGRVVPGPMLAIWVLLTMSMLVLATQFA